MNEGGMIKMYMDKEHINEAEVAAAIGIPENQLHLIFGSQTVNADVKQKLKSHFNRDIFDGSLLTEAYTNVPDNQANKSKR